MAVSFNGLSLTVRDSSGATKQQITDFALNWSNEVSAADAGLDWFVFVFDARDKEFGLLYSDALREALGLENTYYQLVAPTSDVVPTVANPAIDYEKIKQDVILMIPNKGVIDYVDLADKVSKLLEQGQAPQTIHTTLVQTLSEEEKQALVEKTIASTKSQLTEQLTRELTLSITQSVTKQVLAGLPKTTTGDSSGMTETEISAVVESKAATLVEKQLPMLQDKIDQFFSEKAQPLDADFKLLRDDINKKLGELRLVQDDIDTKKQAFENQFEIFLSEKEKASQQVLGSQEAQQATDKSIEELQLLSQSIKDQVAENTEADRLREERIQLMSNKIDADINTINSLKLSMAERSEIVDQSITNSLQKVAEVEEAVSGILSRVNSEVSAIGDSLREELSFSSDSTEISKLSERLGNLDSSLEQLEQLANKNTDARADTESALTELRSEVSNLSNVVTNLNQPVSEQSAPEEEALDQEMQAAMGGDA